MVASAATPVSVLNESYALSDFLFALERVNPDVVQEPPRYQVPAFRSSGPATNVVKRLYALWSSATGLATARAKAVQAWDLRNGVMSIDSEASTMSPVRRALLTVSIRARAHAHFVGEVLIMEIQAAYPALSKTRISTSEISTYFNGWRVGTYITSGSGDQYS